MSTQQINESLLKLVQGASMELLKIYFDKPNRKTQLKFPRYQNKNDNIRVSEQELRFTLTHFFHTQFVPPEFYYSVETPTVEKYSFNGKKERSAATDLSFYHKDKKILNIELKAHNAKQESINKDIEKLTIEDVNGAWIHILRKEDAGTVKTLFNKFVKAFSQYRNSKKPISFHILILESHVLLSRIGKEKELNYCKDIFNIEYSLWNNKLEPGKNLKSGDWLIEKFNIK